MDETASYYDTIAPSYDELYRQEQYAKYKHVYEELGVYPGDSILDIGCGTGLLIDYLKRRGLDVFRKYVCVDPSIEMIKKAAAKHGDDLRIIFSHTKCEELSFRERYFDHIVLFTVWDNLDDKFECLDRITRSAADTSTLILTRITRTKTSIDPTGILTRKNFLLMSKTHEIDEILVYLKSNGNHGNKILK